MCACKQQLLEVRALQRSTISNQ